MEAIPNPSWIQDVRRSFELYRDGSLLELARVPLASSPLVLACLLPGEPATPDACGRALGAVLHWAVNRLRPGGEQLWGAYQWRTYNVLFHFYLRRMRASDLADRMAVSEQTIYDARAVAMNEVARVLQEELAYPQDVEGRQHAYIAERYALLARADQTLLRFLAVFRQPEPVRLLQETWQRALAQGRTQPDFSLTGLLAARLVISDAERITVRVPPEARPSLLTLLSPAERQAWHRAASQHYQAQRDYLEAAIHSRMGGQAQTAADLLVANERSILDTCHMADLRSLLDEFRAGELRELSWAQLKIISGRLAEAMQDVDAAVAEYGRALAAPSVDVKALAYYLRGKVLKQKNIDEALVHFQHCIQILRPAGAPSALLARAQIGRAWIYFEDRQDLGQAADDLAQAQQVIETGDLETLAELHNAWGEFYFHAKDLIKARDHHLECHRIATEMQHVELILKSLHNVGLIYAEQQRYQQGLTYLLQCQALAAQTGHRRMEGLSNSSIGACYFWLADYTQAIHYYQRAYAIFVAMGKQNWQAGLCYDLAEAYAAIGGWPQARAYYEQGLAVARELDHARYQRSFSELARRHPELDQQLGQRQGKIMAFVTAQGAITSAECARLLELSKEQAIRELNELVEKKILARVGVARATRYVLVELE